MTDPNYEILRLLENAVEDLLAIEQRQHSNPEMLATSIRANVNKAIDLCVVDVAKAGFSKSLAPQPAAGNADFVESVGLMLAAIGYTEEYARQWPKEKVSVTFKRWFDEQIENATLAQPALKWCDQCGEGVTDFCRGKGVCGYGFKPAGQPAQPEVPLTYSSTQATKCACCGVHKHTPLRVDFMGGYVCLTCIDMRLDELHDSATMNYKRGYGLALSDAEEAIDDECRERVVTASDCIEIIRNLGAEPKVTE